MKKGEEVVGNQVNVKVVKNKVAPPFRTTSFFIMYNEGISWSDDVLDTGLKYEVIRKQGNSHLYGEVKLGVGREQARTFLRENPKLAKEIEKAVWKRVKELEAETAK